MTALISTRTITKSYGVNHLFTELSLSILAGDRIGLVGPNGSGKSTLLKILANLEIPDEGEVVRDSSIKIVYLAQEDAFNPRHTIKQILFGDAIHEMHESECERLIWQVTGQEKIFPDLNQLVDNLSGGWRKRLAIIAALIQNPDLLLIDEPTNHLDLEGILWMEDLLQKTACAFILVSHDRYFLENIPNTIIELNKVYPEGYFRVSGSYSVFLEKKEDLVESQLKKEQSLSNKMRREKDWLQRMPKARTTKAQFRIDNAGQLEKDLKKISQSNAHHKKVIIDFESTERRTKALLTLEKVGISRGEKLLFKDLSFTLSPGKSLGLLGRNGSGKSTLMSLLNGSLLPDEGEVRPANNLRVVTFDQKRENLNKNQTLKDALSPSGDNVFYKEKYIHVASWAKKFLFSPDRLQQHVGDLSGGEQARVLIANLMLQPADILLLDEPTNDLDIPTLEVLEESLSEFSGALVLITHDRFLLDRLSDQLLYLDGNGKAEFFADYAQWYHQVGMFMNASEKSSSGKSGKQKASENISYEERKELSRLPVKIEKMEANIVLLEQSLQSKDVASNPNALTEVYKKIDEEKQKLHQVYERWELLESKLKST